MLDAVVNNLNENGWSLIVERIALVFFIDAVCRTDVIYCVDKRIANVSGIVPHFG